jgi:hypothetical protein
VDTANRLHFYVLDHKRDRHGVLSYTVAIRSLDGAGPQPRGVAARPAQAVATGAGWARCTIPVRNTGRAGDVYRVTASAGAGWTTWLPRAVTDVAGHRTGAVEVYVKRAAAKARPAKVAVTITSESNPAATTTTTCGAR